MKQTIDTNTDFFVAALEAGAEHPALPAWGNRQVNPANLSKDFDISHIERRELIEVPGAFQLLNVLSKDECAKLIDISEQLGFLPDAAVSLPRSVRHNDSLTWIVDEQTDGTIWQRIAHLMDDRQAIFGGRKALGINARFRFYRYNPADYFKPHSDGSWPGSRIIGDELVTNAYSDRYSEMTFLILLSEDFQGGETRFLVNADDPNQPASRNDRVKNVDVRTPVGGILCFPHGMHPLQCIHSSLPITEGIKYIIRSDVLFEL
ncbi:MULTISPECIES: 2OG-Fe(II) oxygenase [unclassified Colwellia]|uniref:prolyl hydroxylase family protein n=1 Tax=unclassified Colwellia TaxID=196834 RepID=UPI0015F6F720|nr:MULTISPECIES: 2OG-Fe(II) oxygenase [unclassified Colwellia]MBA6378390.1 2OG-Fe(II) oxygenase [Colwellia sp. BRX10-7]MBA6386724.1 2OG-Fe(II) oxygenase [Colwellia sp. BRX10-2]MBA6400376.1 2OG-Fe(II) oxygenase [Colwellia sp. BRX10-5]MBA6404985.1 2OG-Fe(II) oxygenase [Colwellia sp. BRX10-1]